MIRKVFEMGLTEVLGEEAENELAQFGFEILTNCLWPTVLVLADLQGKGGSCVPARSHKGL